MKYTDFPERNMLFTAPKNKPDVGTLPAYVMPDDEHDSKFIFSCFEITPDEILEVIMKKRIWLQVNFPYQPPIALFAESPFDDPNTSDALKKERRRLFKRRLVKAFLSEEFDQEIDESSFTYQTMLNFIDFLMKRGE